MIYDRPVPGCDADMSCESCDGRGEGVSFYMGMYLCPECRKTIIVIDNLLIGENSAMEGSWHDIKVLVKPPKARAVWVPLLVLYMPDEAPEDMYEITDITMVDVPKGPEWGNRESEIKWLEKWARPDLWQQIAWRVQCP